MKTPRFSRLRTVLLVSFLAACPACVPEAGGDTESIAQCPGNHPDDSLAIWIQTAQNTLRQPGYNVTSHPSRNCLVLAVQDSARFPEAEALLRQIGIPRDAVVLTAEP